MYDVCSELMILLTVFETPHLTIFLFYRCFNLVELLEYQSQIVIGVSYVYVPPYLVLMGPE